MTPKEASIELEQAIALIYDALNRNNDDDTWSELTAAAAHLRKVQSAFTGPLRNKPKSLHPPSVPAAPMSLKRDSGGARPLGRLE